MRKEGIGLTDQALDSMLRRVLLDADGQEYGDAIEKLPEHDFSPAFEIGRASCRERV